MSDYEVGYGKPPKKTQWKKGQSGNPKGSKKKQPKQPQSLQQQLASVLDELVAVSATGEKITASRALTLKMLQQAMSGSLRDKLIFLAYLEKSGALGMHEANLQTGANDDQEFTEEDDRILEIARRMLEEDYEPRQPTDEWGRYGSFQRRYEDPDPDDDEDDLRKGQL